MRQLLLLLLLGFSASAHATLIQYDLQGVTNTGQLTASLLLDTAGASTRFTQRFDGEDNPDFCFRSFGADLSGRILGIAVDGLSVFDEVSGIPASASVGGEFREASCIPGLQFLAGGLSLTADSYQLSLFFRATHAIPTVNEVLATPDPLATVLLNGRLMGDGDGTLSLLTGSSLRFSITDFSVRDVTASVPEPSTLPLALLGLAGFILNQGVRRRWTVGAIKDGGH